MEASIAVDVLNAGLQQSGNSRANPGNPQLFAQFLQQVAGGALKANALAGANASASGKSVQARGLEAALLQQGDGASADEAWQALVETLMAEGEARGFDVEALRAELAGLRGDAAAGEALIALAEALGLAGDGTDVQGLKALEDIVEDIAEVLGLSFDDIRASLATLDVSEAAEVSLMAQGEGKAVSDAERAALFAAFLQTAGPDLNAAAVAEGLQAALSDEDLAALQAALSELIARLDEEGRLQGMSVEALAESDLQTRLEAVFDALGEDETLMSMLEATPGLVQSFAEAFGLAGANTQTGATALNTAGQGSAQALSAIALGGAGAQGSLLGQPASPGSFGVLEGFAGLQAGAQGSGNTTGRGEDRSGVREAAEAGRAVERASQSGISLRELEARSPTLAGLVAQMTAERAPFDVGMGGVGQGALFGGATSWAPTAAAGPDPNALSSGAPALSNSTAVSGSVAAQAAPGAAAQGHSSGTQAAVQIATQMADALRINQNVLRMSLYPPELGKVRVVMRMMGTGIEATVFVERAETLDLLQQDRGSLSRALNQLGFTMRDDGLSFELEGDGEGSMPAGEGGDGEADGDGGDEANLDADGRMILTPINGMIDVRV